MSNVQQHFVRSRPERYEPASLESFPATVQDRHFKRSYPLPAEKPLPPVGSLFINGSWVTPAGVPRQPESPRQTSHSTGSAEQNVSGGFREGVVRGVFGGAVVSGGAGGETGSSTGRVYDSVSGRREGGAVAGGLLTNVLRRGEQGEGGIHVEKAEKGVGVQIGRVMHADVGAGRAEIGSGRDGVAAASAQRVLPGPSWMSAPVGAVSLGADPVHDQSF